ncbi:MAG: hypothetical protein HUU38_05290, partial [Anaerolineales bacterium]|nr:hypothetical protein [Anaerolineales bacterium]
MKALVLALAGRRRLAVITLGLVALLVAGGASFAATRDGSDVISGCFAKRTGVLRVVETGVSQCRGKETLLT